MLSFAEAALVSCSVTSQLESRFTLLLSLYLIVSLWSRCPPWLVRAGRPLGFWRMPPLAQLALRTCGPVGWPLAYVCGLAHQLRVARYVCAVAA